MIGFVFDANAPWDLEKIGKLDEMLKILEDNLNFRIYISELNFNEMPVRVRTKLSKYQHVIIDPLNDEEYDNFRREIRDKNIILDRKDSAVLYTSNKIDADYIVSTDTTVQLMAKRYADIYNKKVKPFHLLDMFSFLHKVKLIESNSCIKMALSLYKNKEIPYMVVRHGELIDDITKRNAWIKEETKLSVNTFNSYEHHIILLR